jgi:hypothetical protein
LAVADGRGRIPRGTDDVADGGIRRCLREADGDPLVDRFQCGILMTDGPHGRRSDGHRHTDDEQ